MAVAGAVFTAVIVAYIVIDATTEAIRRRRAK